MKFIKKLHKRVVRSIEEWSTKKKLFVLIVVWVLIFIPSIISYTYIHRESKFSFYPEEASPISSEQEDWNVEISPEGEQIGDRYVIDVNGGQSVKFEWIARNYTAVVHIGQVNVYYETSWNDSGVIRLNEAEVENETIDERWLRKKRFDQEGNIKYYFRVDQSDLPRFQRRASVIIEGGNLYEDIRTDPPPLINFYFIPPTLLAPSLKFGGYLLSFYIYFSIFILVNSLMIFYLFKEWGENEAFLSSLLFIANPISVYTLFQDEGIIAFTIILSLFLVIKNKKNLGSISIGLGVITKVWSGFLAPAQLYDKNSKFKKRIKRFIISVGTAILTLLLFYLLWGPKTLGFIGGYGGVNSGEPTGGISILNSLRRTPLMSEWMISASVILVIIGIIQLAILYLAYKKDWDFLLVFTAIFALFLVLYPKIHWEYYIMLLPSMLFYAVRDKRILSIFIGLIIFSTSARMVRYSPSYPDPLTTYMAFIFSTTFSILIFWMIYLFIRDEKFKSFYN